MIEIKYKNRYDKFIEHYKNVHVNPWHEINEGELKQIYNDLIDSMDIDNEYSFKYFMDYIIKRISGTTDAHTKYDLISIIPMNFRMFENEILINYPYDLKGSKLISMNGIQIDTIIQELEEVITYGTNGKRKYEIEKALFNKYILFGLPSLRNLDELIFEIEKTNGEKIIRKFQREESYSKEELFDYDKYRYGDNATYEFIQNCLIYHHSSVQLKFIEKIEMAIHNLRKEDLSSIDTIIVDIRGNTGGNSSLNQILIDFIKENKDKKLLCLIDYRVFSGGRYALMDLINLGAITIGEEISTPMNCYGNCDWITVDEHYFSSSCSYLNPIVGWSTFSKDEFLKEATGDILEPYIFRPNIFVEQTKEDYIQGLDMILNYAIEYSKKKMLK